jgi:cysteine desulfurase
MTDTHPGLVGRAIYVDYNATTPIDPRVFAAMTPYLRDEFGNPSSSNDYGATAKAAMEAARGQIATLIGASAQDITFTASGSEADALAIRGKVLTAVLDGRRTPHVITQVTEHPAVLAACRDLEELHGVAVTYLPVDRDGLVSAEQVAAALTEHTVLVSIMHANNETGTIMPIREIAAVAHARGVTVHCDAAQSVGKVDVNVAALDVDLLTIVGHKMYAPKGVAALYARSGLRLRPIVGGGGQEHGLRAGTENVAYIVGLGLAAELAASALAAGETARLTGLRDEFETLLDAALPGRVHLNGHRTRRLPNTLNVRIDGVPALALLADMSETAASAGSACHAGRDEPSAVLTAMGISEQDALSAIRLSLGRWSTMHEVEQAASSIAQHVHALDH